MDIRQLNYFVQVAKCGSYSLASQKLYISQPALSKAIKSIEDEIGFSFFYTHQKKQKLTDEGKAFYEKAVKLLENYEELIKMTYLEAEVDRGHLNIGLSVAAGPGLFSHIYPIFRDRYPNITVSVMEKETGILKEEVLKKNLDLAFIDIAHVREAEDSENFEIFELVESDIGIVTYSDSPLADADVLSLDALQGQDMLLFNGGKDFSGQVESDMKRMGVKANVVLSSTQWNFIIEMVGKGVGSVMCPYYIYRKFKNPDISFVRLSEEMGRRYTGIIAKKGDYRNRACNIFLDIATSPESYNDVRQYFKADAEQ